MAQTVSASGVDFLAPHKKNSKIECALCVYNLIERKFQLKAKCDTVSHYWKGFQNKPAATGAPAGVTSFTAGYFVFWYFDNF